MLEMPYFMENKEWYTYDDESEKFVLTENAPVEAVESYKQYLKDYEKSVDNSINRISEDDEEDEDVANLFGF